MRRLSIRIGLFALLAVALGCGTAASPAPVLPAAPEATQPSTARPTPTLAETHAPIPTATTTPIPPKETATPGTVAATPITTPVPGENPAWLKALIRDLENEPVRSPPAYIAQYEYLGKVVYYMPGPCCDVYSDLYDADGNLMGHPDGGITGQGDGTVLGFTLYRKNEEIIWEDERVADTSLVQTAAPVERVEILVLESFPPQYTLMVFSGLPNSCVSFGGYRKAQQDQHIEIELVNMKPADSQIACGHVYQTVETTIALGSDFEPGATYTVTVNDVTESFVAQ